MLSSSTNSSNQILVVALELICVWSFVTLSIWSILKNSSKCVNNLKRLHQIPCSNCAFFTNDYRLKCTVHPLKALSEEAIGCQDFEPGTTYNLQVYPNCDGCKSRRK